jgi:pyruvate formate lyase activating enzyme
MNPLIFDIQRFSIHDGPGIRTTIFLKGCNLECPWCQNPESISLKPEIAFYPDKCILSKDCLSVCEENAIIFENNKRIDHDRCTGCGKCTEACVSNALKLIGKDQTVNEVLEEIKKDMDYYNSSGGGVTISGGEPTLHFDFVLNLLKECKRLGINTNIETNAYFNWQKFKKLLPYLDLIYCDIKIINDEKNKKILKGDSLKMTGNIKKLTENNAPVEYRLPLIPGFTTTSENLTKIIELLKSLSVNKLHLLPYHNMGEAKADKINSKRPKLNLNYLSQKEIDDIISVFNKENINVSLNN